MRSLASVFVIGILLGVGLVYVTSPRYEYAVAEPCIPMTELHVLRQRVEELEQHRDTFMKLFVHLDGRLLELEGLPPRVIPERKEVTDVGGDRDVRTCSPGRVVDSQ